MKSLNEQKGIEIQRVQSEIASRADENLGLRNQVQDTDDRIAMERRAGDQLANEIDRTQAELDDTNRRLIETQD
jgi:uncharacterized coiled-coil DUF342 family protein